MKVSIPAAAIVMSLLLAAGCFEKVPLSITNGLEIYDVHCVYISRTNDNVWGTNHLPGTDILEPGKTAEVMVVPGEYDIQVLDQDGDTYTLNDVQVGTDGFQWTVTIDQIDQESTTAAVHSTGECEVIITNDLSSWDIEGIWISRSDSDSWGDNHLQGETLYPGDTYTAYVEPGLYDIYLEDEDTDTYTKYGISIGTNGFNWNVTLDDLDSSGG